MAIFKEYASKYWELGFSVLPLKVNDKFPVIKEWQHYCKRLPTKEELDDWIREYPMSNIGIALGEASQLIVLDIDSSIPEIVSLAEEIFTPSKVAKKGKKAWSRFYRYTEGTPSRALKVPLMGDDGKLGDILSDGRQTVVPPSIHPETNLPYTWITPDTLLDIYFTSELPELKESEIQQFLRSSQAFLKKNGYTKEDEKLSVGRNDYLKSIAASLSRQRVPIETAAKELLKADKLKHGTHALFEDQKEVREQDPYMAALRFYTSVYQSINNRRVSEGFPPEVPYDTKPKDVTQDVVEDDEHKCETYESGFYRVSGEGKMTPDYLDCAKYFKSKYKLRTTAASHYIYNGKFYDRISDFDLKVMIDRESKHRIKIIHLKNFKEQTVVYCGELSSGKMSAPVGWINCNNGILDPFKQELHPHSYKYDFRYCLSYDFDPNATAPFFMERLNEWMDGDQERIDILQEYMGYILAGGKPWLEKGLCLIGEGQNGKSIFLDTIKEMVGTRNASSISLLDLRNTNECIKLEGKLVNISDESPSTAIDSERFKALMSGGDVSVKHLYSDSFDMPVTTRFVFSTNHMPRFNDSTNGIKRKLLFMPFDREFKEKVDKRKLLDGIFKELPGILNFAIQGLRRINIAKDFGKSRASEKMHEEWVYEVDSVQFWFDHYVDISQNHPLVYSQDLYYKYKIACNANGNNPVSFLKFSKKLSKIVKNKKYMIRQDRSENGRGYSCIKAFDYIISSKSTKTDLYSV